MLDEPVTENVSEVVEASSAPARHQRSEAMTAKERAHLNYQRELSRLAPGSAAFRLLKKSHRSMRVFNQPAVYWPTGRALTESGNNTKRR